MVPDQILLGAMRTIRIQQNQGVGSHQLSTSKQASKHTAAVARRQVALLLKTGATKNLNLKYPHTSFKMSILSAVFKY